MGIRTGRRAAAAKAEATSAMAVPLSGSAFVLSALASVASGLAAGVTLFVPGILRGPAVMNGSARGTAVVVLSLAVPMLLFSMTAVMGGSARTVISWLGALAYLIYNAVLFLFMTPFNQLFLLYVAMFGLSFWSIVCVLYSMDVPSFARRFSSSMPAHAVAAYIGVIGALNGLAWLGNVIPAVVSTAWPAWLKGTGTTTNAVYVQDLSFWVPLQLVSAVWLWLRRPWGMVLAGAVLVFGFIESISIGVDQWMGHAADPSSSVASDGLTPLFLALAAIQLIPTFFYFRSLKD